MTEVFKFSFHEIIARKRLTFDPISARNQPNCNPRIGTTASHTCYGGLKIYLYQIQFDRWLCFTRPGRSPTK